VLYSGKCQSLGIKSTPPSPAAGAVSPAVDWKELAIVKCPRIVQCSVGHDGQHCLLVADDGSVFFVGVSRRGEDGESMASLCQCLTALFIISLSLCLSVCHTALNSRDLELTPPSTHTALNSHDLELT